MALLDVLVEIRSVLKLMLRNNLHFSRTPSKHFTISMRFYNEIPSIDI
jgi:hypothetical protein